MILQDFHTHQFEAERLGRSVRYPFYSIFKAVRARPQGGLSIQLRRDRPPETRQSGIYVWHHPDWGYFYVGIAAADNFTERWNKHIQKLLDQCSSARQMANWKAFADKFRAAGYGIDDLKDVTLRFYPRPNPGSPTFKQELKDLETRIVKTINPACNFEYDPSRPSATRIPPGRQIAEVSPDTLAGSWSKDLNLSRLWAFDELSSIQDHFDTVYILGSWFGNAALMLAMFKKYIDVDHLINVDVDRKSLKVGDAITDKLGFENKIDIMHKDANLLDYRQLGNNGLVMNLSCINIRGRDWFDNIPSGTMVVLQGRNNDSGAVNQFDCLDEFVSSYPLSQVFYQGQLPLTDPETKFDCYMVIGRK